jgi:hypothetical protein
MILVEVICLHVERTRNGYSNMLFVTIAMEDIASVVNHPTNSPVLALISRGPYPFIIIFFSSSFFYERTWILGPWPWRGVATFPGPQPATSMRRALPRPTCHPCSHAPIMCLCHRILLLPDRILLLADARRLLPQPRRSMSPHPASCQWGGNRGRPWRLGLARPSAIFGHLCN